MYLWLLLYNKPLMYIISFNPHVSTLSNLRRKRMHRGLAVLCGRGDEVEGEAVRGENTQCNTKEIHHSFCLTFCFFLFSKMFIPQTTQIFCKMNTLAIMMETRKSLIQFLFHNFQIFTQRHIQKFTSSMMIYYQRDDLPLTK